MITALAALASQDTIHAAGYAIEVQGESSIFERIEGKYLRYWDGKGAWEDLGTYRATVTDARGAMVDSFSIDFAPGLRSMAVPVSGMVSLARVH